MMVDYILMETWNFHHKALHKFTKQFATMLPIQVHCDEKLLSRWTCKQKQKQRQGRSCLFFKATYNNKQDNVVHIATGTDDLYSLYMIKLKRALASLMLFNCLIYSMQIFHSSNHLKNGRVTCIRRSSPISSVNFCSSSRPF